MAETNSERANRLYGEWNYNDNLKNEDVDWLIEQAKENVRLREALEFYADKERYEMWQENTGNHFNNEWTNDVTYDGGEKARQALGRD